MDPALSPPPPHRRAADGPWSRPPARRDARRQTAHWQPRRVRVAGGRPRGSSGDGGGRDGGSGGGGGGRRGVWRRPAGAAPPPAAAPSPPPRGGVRGVRAARGVAVCGTAPRAAGVARPPRGGRRQPAGAAGAPARVRAVVCADGLVAAGAAQGWLTGVVTRAVDPLEKWLAGDHRVSSFVSHQFRAMWIGRCHVGRSSGPAARAITAPLQSARPKIDWISVERVWTGARLVANVGVERDGAPARP